MATRTLKTVQSELRQAINAKEQDADLIRRLSDEEETLRIGEVTNPIAIAPDDIGEFTDTGAEDALIAQQREEASRPRPDIIGMGDA